MWLALFSSCELPLNLLRVCSFKLLHTYSMMNVYKTNNTDGQELSSMKSQPFSCNLNK
jgi:hypothetical protein